MPFTNDTKHHACVATGIDARYRISIHKKTSIVPSVFLSSSLPSSSFSLILDFGSSMVMDISVI